MNRKTTAYIIKQISIYRVLFYLTGIVIFLMSVLYENTKGVVCAAVFVSVVLGGWIYGMTEKRKKVLDDEPVPRISKRVGRRMVYLTILLFLGSLVFTFYQEEALVRRVYQMEGTVYRLLRQISGSADEAVASGTVNRGNNYRTGTVQLKLGTMEKPTESLYLKGFSGGAYRNSEWEAADDDALLQNVVKTLHWEEWLDMVRNMYYNMYFVLSTDPTERMDSDVNLLSVRPEGERLHTFYVPYYSRWSRWNGRGAERNGMEYHFEYFQQKDVSIDWEIQREYIAEAAEWYQELQKEYIKEMEDAYTDVPLQDLPRLAELVKEHPLSKLDEITAFITATLQEHADYTLTPGRIPVNQETVEYFLFESGEGYCQHFASTAALMYRMYGIPARYASGYRVDPENFIRQEDGRWSAEVTDESAHAWVEIFLEDYGWTPIEVTPSSDGSITPSYPGMDMNLFSNLPVTIENNLSRSEQVDEQSNEIQEEDNSKENDWKLPNLSEYRELFQMAGVVLLYTMIMLPILLDYRRLRRLECLKQKDCCMIYEKWLEMLHFCKILQEYQGLEDTFPDKAKEITGIGYDELTKMQEIIRESVFSPRNPDIEERFVAEQYRKSADFLKRQQTGVRRILFSYWKNYG